MNRTAGYHGKKWTLFAGMVALMVLPGGSLLRGAENDGQTLKQRNRLIKQVENEKAQAVPALIKALKDENALQRMTAVHLLVKLGKAGRPGFEAALKSPDIDVRLAALNGLADLGLVKQYWPEVLLDVNPVVSRYVQLVLMKEHPQPEGKALDRLLGKLEKMYRQGNIARQRHVLNVIASLNDLAPATRRLLKLATKNEKTDIRLRAYQVVLDHITTDWDEAAQLLNAALADSSKKIRDIGQNMRWKLMEVKHVSLPKDGWRFRVDPHDVGRKQGWYNPGFDDATWRSDVLIESSWKAHMKENYNGVGWYRRSLQLPKAPKGNRVYLHFEGVDEEAWVWVNGTSVGKHAIGKEGWNVPFVLDITKAVKLGRKNHLTVRAKNTSGGAGIWRPVHLRILNTNALKSP